ncbi:ceramide-1-phosphate transfer [Brachionus plicatilis]|uniref:Ceramide-1-phosphate transfer n=1 Tax=Brachionus plicatilis TaxID=10195 RepID=A0A3M7PKB0_BRAPC|nr:ceramide-1-phosphate transfer [Brachionus plicatilis]
MSTHHHHHHHQHHQTEFDPERLFNLFKKCLIKSNPDADFDDISIPDYIQAYEEINKFLSLLGNIFYFVISDVNDKINIFKKYLEKEPDHYSTLNTFLKYEQEHNKLRQSSHDLKHHPSGARTLLRLHRALIFIYKFLDRLSNADSKQKSAQICIETYEQTLARYHSWLIRKAANLGMHGLPKRDALIGHMIRTDTEKKMFPEFISTVEKTYNITQSYYEKYGILDLA